MSMIEEKGAIICSDSAYLEYRNEGLEKSQEEQVYNELIVPKGGEYRLRLVDGSLVVINSGSRLRFPVSFNGKSREVFLSGGACFEVAKDSLKPFIVHANEADVRVLGTLFDVSAYEDEERVEVTLVNGAVKIAVDGSNARLVPNEQFVFNRRTGETLVREVDAESYIAWTNGIFRFDALYDVERVATALDQASREADSYLAVRLAVPLDTPAGVPQPLRAFVCDMARYHLTAGFGMQVPEDVEARYKAALAWLKDVAKGAAEIVVPTPPDAPEPQPPETGVEFAPGCHDRFF